MPRSASTSSRQQDVAIKAESDLEQVPVTAVERDGAKDEIVREMDVYLSPAMTEQLYLMQYPLQHRSVPLPDMARIKVNHGLLELDQAIPAGAGDSGNYILSHKTQRSHTISVCTHMALGKVDADGNIHLVPLQHIEQMRPSFKHVDESQELAVQEMEEEKLEKKPVLFQKKETERAALARKSSFAYKKSSQESEPWQMLVVCGPDTLQHRQSSEQVACPSPSTKLYAWMTAETLNANSAFVRTLNYLPSEAVTNIDETSSEGLSYLCAQLTTVLHRGWPVPFSVLQSQFVDEDDRDLLTALTSCAVLMRGNFVLQSRLLPLSPSLQQTRTFILFLIQRFGCVERVRLNKMFEDDVTPEAIQLLLEQVASPSIDGWLPKLPDNVGFCELHPETTQLHTQYWERQAIRFSDLLTRYNDSDTE